MQYLLYDLGQAKEGGLVEIALGYAANVRVLDEANYELFQKGAKQKFTGGYIQRSPYKAVLPSDGHWYIIIDAGSFFGKIKCLVKFTPDPAEPQDTVTVQPEVREMLPGGPRPEGGGMAEALAKKKPRVFITHYFKDSSSVALPLAKALEERGVSVNCEDYVLEPGHDLEELIKDGISKYKRGIFIISRSLLKAGWKQTDTEYLKMLIEEKYIQPIWHNVTKEHLDGAKPEWAELHAGKPTPSEMNELVEHVMGWLVG